VISLVKVAVDAMGGDYAPEEIIKGAISALSSLNDLYLYLVGRREIIEAILKGHAYPSSRLEIIHAEERINCHDDPGLSIRNKKDSSMVTALQMVRSGEANAVISAGNTGAFMVGGLLFLGRLGRISRPALLTPMPSFSGRPVLYLDVGANMDARPFQLLQYAFMGKIYAEKILNNLNPRIALLNVGTEANKGNGQVKKAYQLFTENLPGFIGNIEGTEAYFDVADVVVCDGFVGNIFLKTSEGLSRAILSYFRQKIKSSIRYKVGAFLLQPVFLGLKEQVDASGYGGAPLLGVKGLCVKCHGSSKAIAIEQAIHKQVYPFVKKQLIGLFEHALENLPVDCREQ
jgi:phosphate acyltransferase